MPENIHILMTGAGAPGAPGIIQCLRQAPWIQLTVADADAEACGRYLVNDFVQIPKGDAPDFIERIKKVCREKNIQLVLPLVSKELFPFSEIREEMKKGGVEILVSNPEAIKIANNKSLSYQHLLNSGIEVPKFYITDTIESFIHAAFELGHPQRSFCFKPSISNGSRGFRVVSDSLDESVQLFQQKPYNVNITYAHALKILSSAPFPELLVAEYMPGEEYSVDCLANEGEPVIMLPRVRKKMINGISVQGEFREDKRVMDYCGKIIRSLNLHGNLGIQVRNNREGQPLLVEINPRVQGTIVAGLGAGVNLPLLAVKQQLQIPILPEELSPKWGTKFSRFWSEIYY